MERHDPVLIAAYYDGELPAERRAQVAAHLAACPECRAVLDELRALSNLLALDHLPERGDRQARAFAEQTAARLPVRQASLRERAGDLLRTGWRYAPAGLFAAWALLQAALLVGLLAAAGSGAGLRTSSLLAGALGALTPGGGLSGALLQAGGAAALLPLLALFGAAYFWLLFQFAVLFSAWMASWWVSNQ